jgi:hypothetical protein
MAGEDEGGVDEGVRLDEGSVEVDAERGQGGDDVRRRNRDGQKMCPSFRGENCFPTINFGETRFYAGTGDNLAGRPTSLSSILIYLR